MRFRHLPLVSYAPPIPLCTSPLHPPPPSPPCSGRGGYQQRFAGADAGTYTTQQGGPAAEGSAEQGSGGYQQRSGGYQQRSYVGQQREGGAYRRREGSVGPRGGAGRMTEEQEAMRYVSVNYTEVCVAVRLRFGSARVE